MNTLITFPAFLILLFISLTATAIAYVVLKEKFKKKEPGYTEQYVIEDTAFWNDINWN